MSATKQIDLFDQLVNLPVREFQVGDRVTLKNGRGKGQILDRVHPNPDWVYVDFVGKLNILTATPYHVRDLEHDLPLKNCHYLLKKSPTTEEITKLLQSPPPNLELGADVRVKSPDLSYYADKPCVITKISSSGFYAVEADFGEWKQQLGGVRNCDLVGIIPKIEINHRTEWVVDCEKGYRIGLVLAEYKYMEMYWVHKAELLPLERANSIEVVNLPVDELKAIIESIYLENESYGFYGNSGLREAHRLVETNPVEALHLVSGIIGIPERAYELFDLLINPKPLVSKVIKKPKFITGDIDKQALIDRLAELESKRAAIYASGPIAEKGIWIEYGKVSKRKFRQAYYRSNKPIFQSKRPATYFSTELSLVKRQYIGEENSKVVKAAGEAIARRNELERITKEIKLIERRLEA